MILPCFQIVVIRQWVYVQLLMFVRACIPCGPKCLRWKLLMESGTVAAEFIMLLMTCLVFYIEKGVKVWSIG